MNNSSEQARLILRPCGQRSSEKKQKKRQPRTARTSPFTPGDITFPGNGVDSLKTTKMCCFIANNNGFWHCNDPLTKIAT